VYALARRYFGRRAAVASSIVMSVWMWSIKASQMNSAADGGLLTLMILLSTYLFLRYEEEGRPVHLWLTGLAIGLASMTKIVGLVMLPIILIYYLMSKKGFIFSAKKTIYIGILAIIPIALFFLSDLLFNKMYILNSILTRLHDVTVTSAGITTISYGVIFVRLYTYFKILFWASPLVIMGAIFYMIMMSEKKSGKLRDVRRFLDIQLIFICILFLVLTSPYVIISRYIMIIMPILALYFGTLIASLSFKKKELWILGVISCVLLVILLVLNSHITLLPISNTGIIEQRLMHLDFTLGMPFIEETGYSGIVINMLTIIFSFALIFISFIIFIISYIKNHERPSTSISSFSKYAFLVALSLGLAFNLLILSEYSMHLNGPNYSASINDLIDYGKSHQLNEPIIILNNYELSYYLRDNYSVFYHNTSIYEIDSIKLDQFKQYVYSTGGTIIFNDMPMIDRTGELWSIISKCTKIHSFIDKGYEIGYVFDCSSLKSK
jgi:hypothetical protein